MHHRQSRSQHWEHPRQQSTGTKKIHLCHQYFTEWLTKTPRRGCWYLETNWLPHEKLYTGYCRSGILHFDNHTNNWLERYHHTIKSVLGSSQISVGFLLTGYVNYGVYVLYICSRWISMTKWEDNHMIVMLWLATGVKYLIMQLTKSDMSTVSRCHLKTVHDSADGMYVGK